MDGPYNERVRYRIYDFYHHAIKEVILSSIKNQYTSYTLCISYFLHGVY